MAEYRPKAPFNVPMFLFVPIPTSAKGSAKKLYPDEGEPIFCTFRTFGGTERVSNDVLVVEDTAVIETWYRPDIKSDCRLKDADGTVYDILGTPENINRRNQFLRFKIKAIRGGA
jgi:SPP1 family predicted phage head-tail adaptor